MADVLLEFGPGEELVVCVGGLEDFEVFLVDV